MKKIYFILGFLNCIIQSTLGWIFLLILTITNQISDFKVLKTLAFVWEVRKNSWFHKLGKGWYGWCIGNNIILYYDYDDTRRIRSFKHEHNGHVFQNYKIGILYYPIYFGISIYLWLFKKSKHAYLDNYFEIKAREIAGQPKFIPRNKWLHGKEDRWPWW